MTIRYSLFFFFFLLAGQGYGQETVFPGDADNNGRVDHYDVLPTGYAYGQLGPTRPTPSHSEPQNIIVPWQGSFPNGLNYIHADADGNGHVDFLDFGILALNQGLGHGDVTPLAFPLGQAGLDPQLVLNSGDEITPAGGGTAFSFPIAVAGTNPDDRINGLAFNLEYDPELVVDLHLDFSDLWINAGGASFQFQRQEPGLIRVAVSRYGPDPVEGDGLLGTLNMVIIEDLVGLLQTAPDTSVTVIRVSDVQAVDGTYTLLPFVRDSLRILGPAHVDHIAATATSPGNALEARVFPNPCEDWIHLRSREPFERLELIDAAGHRRILYRGRPIQAMDILLPPGAAGFYALSITGGEGRSVLPLLRLPPP